MKKLLVISGLMIFIIGLSSFTETQQKGDNFKPKNLKILSQNITKDSLISMMHSFNAALGADCKFCHEPKQNGQTGLDFSSDENEHKVIARAMMQMTDSINARYFDENPHKRLISNTSCVNCHEKKGIYFQVTCKTCHNGNHMPVTVERKVMMQNSPAKK